MRHTSRVLRIIRALTPRRARIARSEATSSWERFLRQAQRPRRINPATRYGLAFERVTFCAADGTRLVGWYVPAARWTDTGVLMHHFMGGQKAMVLPWIRLFHHLGVSCFALDGRGHGESDVGPMALASLLDRAADVRAAAQAMRRRGITRCFGFGQSQGAAVMLLGLVDHPALRGVVLDSGPAVDLLRASWGFSGTLVPARAWEARLLLTGKLLRHARSVRFATTLWRALRLIDVPLAWVHGAEDRVVPRWAVRVWYDVLARNRPHWRAASIPHAGHVQCVDVDPERVEALVREVLACAAP